MSGVASKQLNEAETILEIRNLTKLFPINAGFFRRTVGHVRAVEDVSFSIKRGETLALVGESGSGKSTLARMIVRAINPTSGDVFMRIGNDTVNIAKLEGEDLRKTRRHYHMIFQDPSSSLNPRMRVLDLVREPLINNNIATGKEATELVKQAIERVGLQEHHLRRYPHAFSGGQRQRIGIARSLVCNPDLIVCDEAVSALDVSIQAQILNLLKDIQKEMDIAYLFIAHDLAVVEHIADRIAVLYVGKMVELAATEDIVSRPLHPYSEALMASVPIADPTLERTPVTLAGEIANPANPPSGCYFHPRCPYVIDRCVTESPAFRELEPGRWAACHRAEELTLKGMMDLDTANTESDVEAESTPVS